MPVWGAQRRDLSLLKAGGWSGRELGLLVPDS